MNDVVARVSVFKESAAPEDLEAGGEEKERDSFIATVYLLLSSSPSLSVFQTSNDKGSQL